MWIEFNTALCLSHKLLLSIKLFKFMVKFHPSHVCMAPALKLVCILPAPSYSISSKQIISMKMFNENILNCRVPQGSVQGLLLLPLYPTSFGSLLTGTALVSCQFDECTLHFSQGLLKDFAQTTNGSKFFRQSHSENLYISAYYSTKLVDH